MGNFTEEDTALTTEKVEPEVPTPTNESRLLTEVKVPLNFASMLKQI